MNNQPEVLSQPLTEDTPVQFLPAQPARISNLRRTSKKRAKLQRQRIEALKKDDAVNALCEAQLPGCEGRAVDCHEVRTRARSGSITDARNFLYLCRSDHRFLTEHPTWSLNHGFTVSSWATMADENEAWLIRSMFPCGPDCEVDHRA